MTHCTTLVALVALALPSAAPLQDDSGRAAGDTVVDVPIAAAELRGHVQALADDALLGREMGSAESLVAARYAAARLAAMGVEPGADDGSYLQPIPLRRVHFTGIPTLRVVREGGEEETLHHGEHFTFRLNGAPSEPRPLEVVVVREEGEMPAEADPDVALVLVTSARLAGGWLEEAGHGRGEGFAMIVVPSTREGGERAVPRDLGPAPAGGSERWIQLSLLGDWGALVVTEPIESLVFHPAAEAEELVDANVVGVLPGAGTEERPELANEVVVLSAHRDHIGVDERIRRADPEADAIHNGADDDASGCAAVLEIAEALAQGERPARTTVVLLVTGEEKGFVGSRHWVAHPTHALERIVGAFNFEMLGRPDELVGGPGGVWLTGDERSDLGAGLRERGIDVRPDPRPSFNFFVRSDNVPFARAGVVAQTLSSFGGHGDYHKVTDEWDTLDYEHMERAVTKCLAAVRTVVEGGWTPEWKEGEPRF